MDSNIVSHLCTDSFLHAIVGDQMVTMTNEHPNWSEAQAALKRRDGAELIRLSSPKKVDDIVSADLADVFEQGSMRIKLTPAGRRLFYKGLMIDNDFATEVIDAYVAGMPVDHYLAFFENLIQNPLESAVNELFEYCKSGRFTITSDGHILAFKRVRADFRDIYTGTFDNSPGTICEVARESVDDDRNVTCSTGLHFCSYEYLPHYGSSNRDTDRVVIVKINPRDIVAIPNDYSNHKGRTCRYEVLREWSTGRLVDGGIVTAESSIGLHEHVPAATPAAAQVTNTDDTEAMLAVVRELPTKLAIAFTKTGTKPATGSLAATLVLIPFLHVKMSSDRPLTGAAPTSETFREMAEALIETVVRSSPAGTFDLSMNDLATIANLVAIDRHAIYTHRSFSTKKAAVATILKKTHRLAHAISKRPDWESRFEEISNSFGVDSTAIGELVDSIVD